jgi:formylmethanofuran dehydrogenase subunit E
VPLKLSGAAEGEVEAFESEAEAFQPEPEAEPEEIDYCERCGEAVAIEDAFVTDGGEGPYCEDCYYELYGRCANCDREVFLDDACQDSNGEVYCEYCYYRLYAICARCAAEIWREDAIFQDGEAYCEDCAAGENRQQIGEDRIVEA